MSHQELLWSTERVFNHGMCQEDRMEGLQGLIVNLEK